MRSPNRTKRPEKQPTVSQRLLQAFDEVATRYRVSTEDVEVYDALYKPRGFKNQRLPGSAHSVVSRDTNIKKRVIQPIAKCIESDKPARAWSIDYIPNWAVCKKLGMVCQCHAASFWNHDPESESTIMTTFFVTPGIGNARSYQEVRVTGEHTQDRVRAVARFICQSVEGARGPNQITLPEQELAARTWGRMTSTQDLTVPLDVLMPMSHEKSSPEIKEMIIGQLAAL
jgi:hypothetical protein